MKLTITFLVAFLIVVHVYTFLKIRKRKRANSKSSVAEFHKKYHKKKMDVKASQNNDSNYKKYITKYNSSLDYISKEEL